MTAVPARSLWSHRLDQRHLQKVWILHQTESFDAYVENNNPRKALPQIAQFGPSNTTQTRRR